MIVSIKQHQICQSYTIRCLAFDTVNHDNYCVRKKHVLLSYIFASMEFEKKVCQVCFQLALRRSDFIYDRSIYFVCRINCFCLQNQLLCFPNTAGLENSTNIYTQYTSIRTSEGKILLVLHDSLLVLHAFRHIS